ncbi:CDP-glycerol glycerophosphotransferase family protein [Terrilactibacillus sp. BCM23-1]|uniref:CDP-glycerol glycerophosphotransferase family protein n=1 Tax=Terrilactibacillus tamarindi TaxID=2599694 RepID=A0A6N8CRM0_9BACI|nr:CDP-glycerol glycerophosphotransferase family protein [Terrilactibacillus tamarindi]MTT30616.1 CDP-glycerol glycerophosphotransferase family protein [Terrilactibacillus tamarindi]
MEAATTVAVNKKKRIKRSLLENFAFKNNEIILAVSYELSDETLSDQVKIIIRNRLSNEELNMKIFKIKKEEYKIYLQASIPKDKLFKTISKGKYWDIYISPLTTDLFEYSRLKSNTQNLELLSTIFEDDLLITPYKTNKGNVSFKVTEPKLLGKIEQINQKNGIFQIEGYAIYPNIDQSDKNDVIKNIIVRDKNHEMLKTYQARNIERHDLSQSIDEISNLYDWAGFSVEIDLKEFVSQLPKEHPKNFVIEIELINCISNETVNTARLKIPEKIHTHKYVLKGIKGKKKIIVKRTKKGRNAIFQVSDYILKKELKSKVHRLIRRFRSHRKTKQAYKQIFKALGKLPARKGLVVFESFLGKQYSCNPRAIYEYLKENYPQYKLVWSVDKRYIKNFEGKDVKYVKRFSIRWLFLMSRAQYWVTNSRFPLWIPKPKHTTYLQTWHGTPLKRLAADMDEVHMPGTNTIKYKANFCKEASRWDYLISPNAYSTEIFARAFQFDKVMIESGYPRNDILYTDNNFTEIFKLKQKYGLPQDKKIILYAPTWRDDQFYSKGKYKFDLDLDLSLMREEFGDEYIVILRMHYLVAENLDLSPYEGFAYDYSQHEDIRELYLISDILMTDYSSVFFDYANLRRPMIFFVYDIENYRDKLRGFYFDFEKTAPGPLVKTTAEVINSIREFEDNDFAVPDNFNAFYDKFCYLENGSASKQVVDKVFLNK